MDDVLTALEKMKSGVRWDPSAKCFLWSKLAEDEDMQKPPDLTTMEQFARMASGILSCLEFTQNCPINNKDGRMPVLDTTMWVDQQEREFRIPKEIVPQGMHLPIKNGRLKQVIMYIFYRKSIANKTPFNMRSAGPVRDKVAQVSQEFLRRCPMEKFH